MKIENISFQNYKAFFERQEMQLKPITILIGKNSSGKSSIAKLFTLLETSLTGEIDQPLLLKNNGVELGEDFDNLFFDNKPGGLSLDFHVLFNNNTEIEIKLLKKTDDYGLDIFAWNYKDDKQEIKLEQLADQSDKYLDTLSKKKYDCNFKGFIPTKLLEENTDKDILKKGQDISKEMKLEKIDVDYIGPFRILPERYFYLTGQTQFRDTGVTGENAYAMLGMSKYNDDPLHKSVGEWYKEHFDGWELRVDNTSKKPLIQIVLVKNNSEINLTDVGQGMNQALPLVVRANVTDRPDSMIIVEQPELHLHPVAHGDIAELFAKSAKTNNHTFMIETHSENMLLRFRKLVVENNFGFTKDDIVIYWLEDSEGKGKELYEITVDEEGVLSDWPEGVFNESMKEILEMQKAIRRKEE